MLRRPLGTRVDANGQYEAVIAKPFKVPRAKENESHVLSGRTGRKRKKVDYREANGGEGGAGDDSADFAVDEYHQRLQQAAMDSDLRRKYPVFAFVEKEVVFQRKFLLPFAQKDESVYNRPQVSLGTRRQPNFVARPLHDPAGEFAIVLYDPTIPDPLDDDPIEVIAEPVVQVKQSKMHKSLNEILGIGGKEEKKVKPKVAVVIDPRLAKVLRPHQIEGVKFLYNCVTGRIDRSAHGGIMADEMGLGKTLQCIALLWTLLKQSPHSGKGEISKCVIACPASLVKNWANELVKWLGKDAITPLAIDGKLSKEDLARDLASWTSASGRSVVRPVLIVSYESLRLNTSALLGHEIGLLLCDEGHRLKNAESRTFAALDSLQVQRRIILSGTPIQNDLSEYFALLNFTNPGLLGTKVEFRRNWELPILRGRDADSTEIERLQGDEKLAQLAALFNRFIIRRTNDILSKYLPIKYEHVVFCALSPLQTALYRYFLSSSEVKTLLRGKGCQPLKAVNILKKLCNHPDLLDLEEDISGCDRLFPPEYIPKSHRNSRDREVNMFWSGKLRVLERMLARIRRDTNDKIVLISNYTQTLDLLERMCRDRR